MQKYQFDIEFVPGKQLILADALSRAFEKTEKKSSTEKQVEVFVDMIKKMIQVSPETLRRIATETKSDETLQKVIQSIKEGWDANRPIKPYCYFSEELSVVDGVILKGVRVVIPSSLRKELLCRIHEGHLGIEKCKRRARETLYWPNMNSVKLVTHTSISNKKNH